MEKVKLKIIGVFDNEGQSFDCYTVVFDDIADGEGHYTSFGMSGDPAHPQGVGMHSACKLGDHLGKRIAFSNLPAECQRVIRGMYEID